MLPGEIKLTCISIEKLGVVYPDKSNEIFIREHKWLTKDELKEIYPDNLTSNSKDNLNDHIRDATKMIEDVS